MTSARPSRRATPLVLLAAASILASILAGHATAGPARARTSVLTEGDCAQIATFVTVPVERVRSIVPSGFTPVGEDTGTAQVLVTGGGCEPWFVDGKPARPLTFGLVSVLIESPTGELAASGYDLWWVFGQADTHAAFRSLGIDSRYVRGTAFEVERTPAGGVASAVATVPWKRNPFTLSATVVDAPARPLELPSHHWYEGPRGVVFGDHTNTEGGVAPGTLTIETTPGSPLAQILGASSMTVPGEYLEFHHAATTALVEMSGASVEGGAM